MADNPRWLAGLIARHGEPLIVRRVYDMSTDLEYEWPDRIVRVGESWGTHFVVAARRGGRVVNLGGLDHQPTDADISGVVALAGLCDAPEVASAAKSCDALCRDIEQDRDRLMGILDAVQTIANDLRTPRWPGESFDVIADLLDRVLNTEPGRAS